ncbi:MAG TPA: ABC transporter substrate-binding protein [Candidatus Limnocylindrales bacterium]|nr:ABC transporter substrate-binding protein [Candidatus Limnocylindrales bacterium]
MHSRLPALTLGLALFAALLAACAGPGSTSPSSAGWPGASTPGGSPGTRTPLSVGLGYIPSVQFAQFYLAEQAGYYREAGLEVTFQHDTDTNVVTLAGQGTIDVGIADGTSVIPAVSQGVPIRYAATIYATFPNVVFSKAATGIATPADLKGRKVGTPFRGGSGWVMLQALLRSAGLTTSDIAVVEFPDFGQRVAVERGVVEAATGFANNEPVQMELAGTKVSLLRVDDITPLPGPGLISGERTLREKGAALEAFVRATLRAMEEIALDPDRGLDAAIARVPELAQQRKAQRAVLEATVAMWQSDYTRANGLGAIDRDAWQRSVAFLASLPDGLVPRPVTVDQLVTQELLDE